MVEKFKKLTLMQLQLKCPVNLITTLKFQCVEFSDI